MSLEKAMEMSMQRASRDCDKMGLKGFQAVQYIQLNSLNFLMIKMLERMEILKDIHNELVLIREATQPHEFLEDAEPDPFQTLNGPRL